MHRPRPALFAASVMTMMALALSSTGGDSAYALSSPLEYSRDGSTWSGTPPDALFDDGIMLVPGDSATRTLHLRNRAAETGALELTFQNVEASDDIAGDTFGVTVSTTSRLQQGKSGERHRISDLAEDIAEAPRVLVAPGETLGITVTVDLDSGVTGKVAQSSTVRLDLAIQFADARATGDGGQPDSPPQVIPVLPPADEDTSGQSDGVVVPPAPSGPPGPAAQTGPSAPAPSVASTPSAAPAVPGATTPSSAERTPPNSADGSPAVAVAYGPLAVTGFTAGALGALAAAMIVGGIVLLRSRRRQEPS